MNLQGTLDALIGREGTFSNNEHDKGGETMWGITEVVARAFGYTGRIADMQRTVAEQIYTERYWQQPGFDKVSAINSAIAEELLDTGVNMGQGTASKFLQRALNVLNQAESTFPNVVADGVIGKMTLAALNAFLLKRGKAGAIVLLRMLNAQQSVRYMELAEANRTQEDFEFGWQLNRVGELA